MIRSSLSKNYQVKFLDTEYFVLQMEDYKTKIWHFYPDTGKPHTMLESITVLGSAIDANKIRIKRGWVQADESTLVQVLGPCAVTPAFHPYCTNAKIWLVRSSKGYIYSVFNDDAVNVNSTHVDDTFGISSLNWKATPDGKYEDYESASDYCDFMRWLEEQLNWAKSTEQIKILLNA
ncbi:hypothetical protein EBR43_05130 [bacterium]|nr:hypothetical protein [bacterium]